MIERDDYCRLMLERRYNIMPTDGLVFWAPLESKKSKAETGQTLTYQNGKFTEIDGIRCFHHNDVESFITATGSYPNVKNPRTLSVWYCPIAGEQMMFGYGTISSYKCFYLKCSGSTRRIGINTSTENFDPPDIYAPDGVWTHILCTFNGSSVKIYVNAQNVASGTFEHTNTISSGLQINKYINAYKGAPIAACRIYNRVISQEEITTLAHELIR